MFAIWEGCSQAALGCKRECCLNGNPERRLWPVLNGGSMKTLSRANGGRRHHVAARLRWLSFLAVVVIGAATLTMGVTSQPARAADNWAPPVHHGVSSLQSCADVAIIGIRGSGQTPTQNEGFGPEVAAVRDSLKQSLGADRSVRQVQIDYESMPVYAGVFLNVDGALNVSNMYLDSIGTGTAALEPVIDDSIARCPNERLVIIGYSQGALVAHMVTSLYGSRADKFAGVVLIADPGRNSEQLYHLGTATPGLGLTGWTGELGAPSLEALAPSVTTICDTNDIVCDTQNLVTHPPSPVATANLAWGKTVHTSYPAGALLEEAADRVTDRVLRYAVPKTTIFDVPIGSPLAVSPALQRMAAGVSAVWRTDPAHELPAGFHFDSSNHTVTGTYNKPETLRIDLQVKAALGDWRPVSLALRVGAGAYCPNESNLVTLSATPRDPYEWLQRSTPAATSTQQSVSPSVQNVAPDNAAMLGTSTGIEQSVVVSQATSARRGSHMFMARGLTSSAGMLVNTNSDYLVYGFGDLEPQRKIAYMSGALPAPWGDKAQPQWLKGSLITGLADAGTPSVIWEALDGTFSGESKIEGNFLTASPNGWYEWYRWPGSFGCDTDNSLVVREVDVKNGTPQRTNVAAIANVSKSIPILASADDGGFALLAATPKAQPTPPAYSEAKVFLWQRGGGAVMKELGSLDADVIADLVPPTGTIGVDSDFDRQSISVSAGAVSIQVGSDRLVPDAHDPYWNARTGDGIADGTVYRFGLNEPPHRWAAKYYSRLFTLGGYTLFDGPDYGGISVGNPQTGSVTASPLPSYGCYGCAGARGEYSTDGTSIYAQDLQGSHWLGTEADIKDGYIRKYESPISAASTPAALAPISGHVASVFGVSISDDSLTWTDDTVQGGRAWAKHYDQASGTVNVAQEKQPVDQFLSDERQYTPWVQGDWSITVRDGQPGYYDDQIVAAQNGLEKWRRPAGYPEPFHVQNGLVALSGYANCDVVSLETGQSMISPSNRARLSLPSYCERIAFDGTTLAWVDWADSTVIRIAELHSDRAALTVHDSGPSASIKHLSLENGNLLLVDEKWEDGANHVEIWTGAVAPTTNITELRLHAATSDANLPEATESRVSQVARSGDRFAVALDKAFTYKSANDLPYRGSTDTTISVYSLFGTQAEATITPPSGQYYMFGSKIAMSKNMLLWSNGLGGVVLSTLKASRTFATATPVISGSVKVGAVLTATASGWTPAPATLTYQWKRAGVDIAGATSSTFTLAPADAGKTLSVAVTGTADGYAPATVVSAATAPVAPGSLTTALVTITGTAKAGYALTANAGSWGPHPVTLAYQWKRAGMNIAGATKPVYTLTGADAGKVITVAVTGSKAGYASASASVNTAAIAAGTLISPAPMVTGTSRVGYVLTAKPGTWTAGTALSYQWYRSGVAIVGARSATYTLSAADLGKRMTVRVTGSQTGYASATRGSVATAAVVAGILVKSTPKITGTLRAGYVLTANPGTWTSRTVFHYQWYRSGIAIKGATAKTYKLTVTDRADTMKVRVTGVKAGYTSVALFSLSTARVP